MHGDGRLTTHKRGSILQHVIKPTFSPARLLHNRTTGKCMVEFLTGVEAVGPGAGFQHLRGGGIHLLVRIRSKMRRNENEEKLCDI